MKRKIAAILAADAVGYSRLVAEDEEEALRRLASYRAVFDDFIGRFGGRIFNTAGDAVLAEFQSAVDALRCSVDLQESLRARNLAYPQSRQMSFRIGITIGDVVERDGDLLGDGVNIASRLESMAQPGGICISRSVYEAVANKLSVKFSDLGRQQLKNIPEPVHAYTVMVGPQSEKQKRTSRPLAPWHWALILCVLVGGAGAAGFLLPRYGYGWKSGTAEPAPTNGSIAPSPTEPETNRKSENTAAAPKSDTDTHIATTTPAGHAADYIGTNAKAPPMPTSDRVAQEAVIRRQWIGCLEGKEHQPTIDACKAIIDYKISSGEQLAMVHLKLGRAQRDNEEVDDAIDSYSEAIRLAPTAEAYNDRGIAHFDRQDWQKAIDDYTEAIKLDQNFGEALNNRAWTQLKVGRANLAIEDANKAVRLLPDKAYAWDTRAHVQEALNNRAQAISDYRKALELDPESQGSRDALKALGVQP